MCCVALRINGTTFADSSWRLHLFVKRLFVLWCHWWSELSPNRNKGGWFGCVRSVPVVDMRMQLATGHITLIITLSFFKTWAEREIWFNIEGRWQQNLVDSKCWVMFLWKNGKIGKKPHANFVRHMQTRLQTLYSLHLCSVLSWSPLQDFMTVPMLFPASFRMELCVAKVFTLGWTVPYLCFWMFFRMWKTGKLTGKLNCRYSGCQRKWNKSRQDTVPHAPSLSHVMKTVKICVDPAFITVAWNFHWNTFFNFIGFSTHPHDGFTSRIGCITDDHDSDLSLTTCFPPILCLWLLCFHGRWNTLAGADGFGKFNCDGADELCNSTHMNELTGSRGSFTFQHSVPLFCAGVYFTGSFFITLLLFLPVDVHGWAKIWFPFHLERAVPFLPFLGHSYKLAVFYRQYKQL